MIIPYFAGMLTVIFLMNIREHLELTNKKFTILSNNKIIEYNHIHIYTGKQYLRKRFIKIKDNIMNNTMNNNINNNTDNNFFD